MQIAIIDDNKKDLMIIYEAINHEIKKYQLAYQITCFNAVDQFDLQQIYDVLFLDIDMPKNGIDLAREYLKQHKNTMIIFISNHDEQFYNAYSVHPYQFIKKNELAIMIKRLIQELVEKLEQQNNTLIIKTNSDFKKILLNQIKYIQSDRHYCIITTINNSYRIREKLSNLEKKINNCCFIRISNTRLINWQYVDEYTSNMVKIGINYFNIARSQSKLVKESRFNYISKLL